MIPKQDTIDALADRIEKAYRLRRPHWPGACSSARVWNIAARVLWEVHAADPVVPPDPELFVAAQDPAGPYPDPWCELTDAGAAQRYRNRVLSIVRALRSELVGEVRLAEQLIGDGQAITRVLRSKKTRISPLGRYIVAHRAGRNALAGRFLPEVVEQHRACPLYREASRMLLPESDYPIHESNTVVASSKSPRSKRDHVQLN